MIILVCPNCDSKFKVKADALGDKGRLVKCAKCQHKWHATADGDTAAAPEPATPKPEPVAKPAAAAEPAAEQTAPAEAPPSSTPPKAEKSALEQIADGDLDLPEDAPVVNDDTPAAPKMDADDSQPSGADAQDAPDLDSLIAPSEPPPIPPNFRAQPDVKTKKRSPLKAWLVLLVLIVATGALLYFMAKPIVQIYPPAQKLYKMIGIPVDTLGHGLEIGKTPTATRDVSGDTVALTITGEITNTTSDIIAVPLLSAALLDSQSIELHKWTFKASERTILPGEKVSYETKVDNPPRGATGLNITFTTAEEEAMKDSMMDDSETGQETSTEEENSQ